MARRRLLSELRSLHDHGVEAGSAAPRKEDLFLWDALLFGTGAWDTCALELQLRFPASYPFEAPGPVQRPGGRLPPERGLCGAHRPRSVVQVVVTGAWRKGGAAEPPARSLPPGAHLRDERGGDGPLPAGSEKILARGA